VRCVGIRRRYVGVTTISGLRPHAEMDDGEELVTTKCRQHRSTFHCHHPRRTAGNGLRHTIIGPAAGAVTIRSVHLGQHSPDVSVAPSQNDRMARCRLRWDRGHAYNDFASLGGWLRYPDPMSAKVTIEVDERTADVLRARAAELGVTVSELLAELASLESQSTTVAPDEIAELDRRWQKIEAGATTVPQERVVRWLRTWGTSGYRPWPAR